MRNEVEELTNLARSLSTRADDYPEVFENWITDLHDAFDQAEGPAESERAVEECTRRLRQLWLKSSAASASRCYRSPLTEEKTRTALGRTVEFGYERDLHPAYLEARCRSFFDKPPKGWSADHILLSSGQSAMAAALHTLEANLLGNGNRKLSFAHLGSYFETAEIFSLFSSLLKPAGYGRPAVERMKELEADVFIIEPTYCDGEFGCVDIGHFIDAQIQRTRRPRIYIFDNTLVGGAFPLEAELESIRVLEPPAVFRLVSGLKLFQGGFELSSVGMLSVFTPDGGALSAPQIGERVRKIRTLLGLGLSFTEVAALEAPWFLDREYTDMYQHAVFENNASLARTISAENRLFSGVFHPCLLTECDGIRVAPFCAFHLREPDAQSYMQLEEDLRCEAHRRGILLEHGGSFGFRGHRFELVHPDDGKEPFLRVALGRRAGWSRDRTIELLMDVSRKL